MNMPYEVDKRKEEHPNVRIKKATYLADLDLRYLIMSDSNMDATERFSLIA